MTNETVNKRKLRNQQLIDHAVLTCSSEDDKKARGTMNTVQQKAVDKFNQALRRLNRHGLRLAGVDGNLLIFTQSQFASISNGCAPAEIINELDYVDTDDECYIDSGAT